MYAPVLQALWIITPVVLAGLIHVAVIRLGVLHSLAAWPLDGGLTFRGRRIFGANKTWRGAVVMPLATAACVALHYRLPWPPAWLAGVAPPFASAHPVGWGLLAGAGYVVGELPNSFIKRQLGIAAGAAAAGGWLQPVCWVVDQVDCVAGVLVFLLPVWIPEWPVVAALLALTLLVHPAVALVMFTLGLKDRVG